MDDTVQTSALVNGFWSAPAVQLNGNTLDILKVVYLHWNMHVLAVSLSASEVHAFLITSVAVFISCALSLYSSDIIEYDGFDDDGAKRWTQLVLSGGLSYNITTY